MFYELAGESGLRLNPLNAIVAPRPIAWISTISRNGQANLAPFSYFNLVSTRPPLIMFSSHGNSLTGGQTDTFKNVLNTEEFVINIASWEQVEKLNLTSVDAPADISEFDLFDIEYAPSQIVRPPRVADAPVSAECRLVNTVNLPSAPGKHDHYTMVIGEIVGMHLRNELVKDGFVNSHGINAVSRLGYNDYGVIGETITLRRPRWENGRVFVPEGKSGRKT